MFSSNKSAFTDWIWIISLTILNVSAFFSPLLLIVNSIHSALLTLLVSGAVMLFIWSYMSKPVAEIQPMKEENRDQMSLFTKNKINRHTFNKNTETNPQRKRFLRSIDDIDNAA